MIDPITTSLSISLVLVIIGWLYSLYRHNVNCVDSLWAGFFMVIAVSNYWHHPHPRSILVMSLVCLWGMRLSLYLSWRNWGKTEDHRYQTIRQNNQPYFGLKSLWLIFGLQMLLAHVVSLPILAIGTQPFVHWHIWDGLGLLLWVVGFSIQVIADGQLARFKKQATADAVLDQGLWRYSRHPNYFGEACMWWGIMFICLASGLIWPIIGPMLITFLLLKVSGVTLMENTIKQRRPAYVDYIQRTNAFIPGPKKRL